MTLAKLDDAVRRVLWIAKLDSPFILSGLGFPTAKSFRSTAVRLRD